MSHTIVLAIGQWKITAATDLSPAEVSAKVAAQEEVPITAYNIYNPDPKTGAKRFYEILPGQYSMPMVIQEPAHKIDLPSAMQLVDGQENPLKADDLNTADKKLVGYVLLNDQSQVTARMSLSNAASKGITPVFQADGALMVAGLRYGVSYLVTPDKNRMRGQVAYCWPLADKAAPPVTQVCDLEDMKFKRR